MNYCCSNSGRTPSPSESLSSNEAVDETTLPHALQVAFSCCLFSGLRCTSSKNSIASLVANGAAARMRAWMAINLLCIAAWSRCARTATSSKLAAGAGCCCAHASGGRNGTAAGWASASSSAPNCQLPPPLSPSSSSGGRGEYRYYQLFPLTSSLGFPPARVYRVSCIVSIIWRSLV